MIITSNLLKLVQARGGVRYGQIPRFWPNNLNDHNFFSEFTNSDETKDCSVIDKF